jgi:hypothetical protein
MAEPTLNRYSAIIERIFSRTMTREHMKSSSRETSWWRSRPNLG